MKQVAVADEAVNRVVPKREAANTRGPEGKEDKVISQGQDKSKRRWEKELLPTGKEHERSRLGGGPIPEHTES